MRPPDAKHAERLNQRTPRLVTLDQLNDAIESVDLLKDRYTFHDWILMAGTGENSVRVTSATEVGGLFELEPTIRTMQVSEKRRVCVWLHSEPGRRFRGCAFDGRQRAHRKTPMRHARSRATKF
jgi:hypothetical protein